MEQKVFLPLFLIVFVIGCAEEGDDSGSDENLCSRQSGYVTTYYYPESKRTNKGIFVVKTRNSVGSWLTGTLKYDNYNDGSIDSFNYYSYLSRNSYGQLLTYQTEYDVDLDGLIDSRSDYTWSRNFEGHPITRFRETDSDLDYFYDSNAKYEYIRDSFGHNFIQKIEYDNNYDGIVDENYTFNYTYDIEGKFASAVRYYDSDNNGFYNTKDSINYTFQYNDNSKEIGIEIRFDEGLNGVTDKITTTVRQYENYECSGSSAKAVQVNSEDLIELARFNRDRY